MPGGGELTAPVELALEDYRRELIGYCYRMLGSGFEAEDAVQETMLRAWRASGNLHAHGALRAWLYRIATNVCLSMRTEPQRRARPMDLNGPGDAVTGALDTRPENTWIEPIPDARVVPTSADPAEIAVTRESVRLAFVAALQHLPPKQRVVLILREVLRWKASEVATLLDTSVASVNSALQRARATLDAVPADPAPPPPTDPDRLLARYVTAFESYDVDSLVALLHEDATMCMPPIELWLRGRDQVRAWLHGRGMCCQGSRLLPTMANGGPAFGCYHPSPEGGHEPWGIQVLELSGDHITTWHTFLDTNLFPVFGLPTRLP